MDMVLRHSNGKGAIWMIGGLALAWNVFGVVQFLNTLAATPHSLMAAGLSAHQAAVMMGYPVWMTVAFAIGVFGGVAGSVLLLLGRKLAGPVFHTSLVGYLALYLGDIIHGVFAAMGAPQIIILSVVVAIAAGLSWTAQRLAARGYLV